MNLPIKRTEEQQKYQHQVSLVRSLVDKGYSPRQIMNLSDVEELGLDKETIKEVLAYQGARRSALGEMVGQTYKGITSTTKSFIDSMFRPFGEGSRRVNEDVRKNLIHSSKGYVETAKLWITGNSLTVTGILFLSENPINTSLFYTATVLGVNAIDGLHEIYKHKRNKIIKQNLSRLEQIASGEIEDNSGEKE